MYITSGNLDTVINWFEYPGNEFRFLCLIVAGHLGDEKLFSDVFDKKEIIDVISGEEISIFLFSNSMDTMTFFELKDGETEIVPGRLLLLGTNSYLQGMQLYKRVTKINSAQLKNYPIKESTIKASQTISNEICAKYQLDLDDIPCILFLEKGVAEPFIIRTKGEIDIKEFFQLIKDVRRLARRLHELPSIYELNYSAESAKLLMAEQETKKQAWVSEAENNLNESINNLKSTFINCGLPVNACEILVNQKTAKKLWDVFGKTPFTPAHPVATEYAEIINNAIANNTTKREIKQVVKNAKEVEGAIYYRRSNINKIKRMIPNLHKAKDATKELCEKYERRFTLKSRYRPMKEFIETVLGISAKARELLSLEESIKKII